jgi:hypothetical protein
MISIHFSYIWKNSICNIFLKYLKLLQFKYLGILLKLDGEEVWNVEGIYVYLSQHK